MVKLCLTLLEGKNTKRLLTIFSNMSSIIKLEERGIVYLGAIYKDRMENCQLRDEKDLNKDGKESFD